MGQDFSEAKKGSWWPYVAGGCLTIIVLIVLAVVAVVQMGRTYLDKLGTQWLADAPIEVPKVEMDDAQRTAAVSRVKDFLTALGSGTAREPFALTSQELNIAVQEYIQYSRKKPDQSENQHQMENVYLDIKDGKISGQLSIPADWFGPLAALVKSAQGKYLNAKATFSVSMLDGRLVVFADSAEIKGAPLPAPMMEGMRKENLAKEWPKKEDEKVLLRRLKNIAIEGDKLVLYPQ